MIRVLLAGMPLVAAVQKLSSEQQKYLTPQERWMYNAAQFFSDYDWRWMLYFTIAALVVFGIILFGALFFRRMQTPRLGFFFYTMVMLIVRTLRPDDLAWNAFTALGAGIALILLVQIHRGPRKVNRREPIYYLLNFFALMIVVFPLNFYMGTVSATAIFASLFFVTTSNSASSHKFKGRTADKNLLESLESRAQRKL